MKNKNGIAAALVGLGVGALAFWGYKRMPESKKNQLKSKFNDAGRKIKETAQNVESSVKEKFEGAKHDINQATH